VKHNTPILWTIDELGSRVAQALAVDYTGAPNGRVRGVPDLRTIRYYTTLGLLDRPAEMRGRTALYGRRHLLQLVAIKRLQADGLALAEVQQRLLGLSDRALKELARLPSNVDEGPRPSGEVASRSVETAFWKTAAAPVKADAAPLVYQGVPLADGVTLLVTADRPLDDDDIQALRTGAAPLLTLLHQRRLRARAEKGLPHDPSTTDTDRC
jgi:DNA-binding transcriptional MerR regulator